MYSGLFTRIVLIGHASGFSVCEPAAQQPDVLQGKGKTGRPREAYIFDLKSDRFARELDAAVNVSFPRGTLYKAPT